MPIKYTITVEEGLEKTLTKILENTRNSFDIQPVLTIYHVPGHKMITSLGNPEKEQFAVVDLYLNDKYAEFHDEFTQTASTNPELKPLVDYVMHNGWKNNLD